MAFRVIAYPSAALFASAVRVPKLTMLALPWWVSTPDTERSSIAARPMTGTTRTHALGTADRVVLPPTDTSQGAYINPDVVVQVVSLEADARTCIATSTMDLHNGSRMLDVTNFKDHTIANTKNIYGANTITISAIKSTNS